MMVDGWFLLFFFLGGEAGVLGEKAIQAILFFDKTVGILKVLEGGHVRCSRAGLLAKRGSEESASARCPSYPAFNVFWPIQRKNGMTRMKTTTLPFFQCSELILADGI